LLRLVVHGILHVLGYDHPEGASRTRSRMWKLQEAYVAALIGGHV
jgi:ssRNA-specific RNase YbeY (16S rRNA maturation enzyme)